MWRSTPESEWIPCDKNGLIHNEEIWIEFKPFKHKHKGSYWQVMEFDL